MSSTISFSLSVLALLTTPALAQEEEPGFAHPELLVSTDWLLEHLEDDGLRVVDVREAQAYAAGHIPLAVNVPRSAIFDPRARGNLGPVEQLAAVFGQVGVDEKTHVILYDEGKSTAAAYVFWALEVYGHPRVSVLDGGFARWTAEDLGAEEGPPAELAAKVCKLQPPSARLTTRDLLLEDVDVEEAAVIDARSEREVAGGRVPGAIHLEWTRNFTADEVPVFLSAAELRALYADQGVTPDKRVHAY